jgi:hypothetical protein
MIFFHKNSFAYTLLAGLLFPLGSCQTETEYEYVTENARYPYKEITTFSIKAGDLNLAAAVAGEEVTVYWPYTVDLPATIAPVITVSEKATIQPASGATVPFEDGVKYTVTAQDGGTTTYTLKVIVNQPEISIPQEDVTSIAIFGGTLDIRGQNFMMDKSKNKVFLIDKVGVETELSIYTIDDLLGTGFGTNIGANIPAEGVSIDTGSYRVKVISGARTVVTPEPWARVRYAFPTFTPIESSLTVQAGETFTLTGQNFRLLSDGRLKKTEQGTDFVDVELVEFTLTSATYRISAHTPAGEYFIFQPGITDTMTRTFEYSNLLHAWPNVHPTIIVTSEPE